MFVKFECELRKDYKVVKKWQAEFESIRIYGNFFEFVIISKSIIHGIIGETFRGKFACFPDFRASCLIYNFKDRTYNFENLGMRILRNEFYDYIAVDSGPHGIYYLLK